MANKNLLFEIDPSITRSIQRSALCTADVDGGLAVTLGAPDVKERDCYTATKAAAGAKSVWVAYNPSVNRINVNGRVYAGLSDDERDYTNLTGYAFDVFKPMVGQVFGVLKEAVKGATMPNVGQFLEPDGGIYAVKATQTADVASFKVIGIQKQPFPKAGIGMEMVDMYVVETVAN